MNLLETCVRSSRKEGQPIFCPETESGQPGKRGDLIYGERCCCLCMLTVLKAGRFQKEGSWSVELAVEGVEAEVNFNFAVFLLLRGCTCWNSLPECERMHIQMVFG